MTPPPPEEHTPAMSDEQSPFPPLRPDTYDYRQRFTAALRREGWAVVEAPGTVDGTHPTLPLQVQGHFRVGAHGYRVEPRWQGDRREFIECPPEGRTALWRVIQAVTPTA